jgi:hypothetical protein
MLIDFLKGNHYEVASATIPWLREVKGACLHKGKGGPRGIPGTGRPRGGSIRSKDPVNLIPELGPDLIMPKMPRIRSPRGAPVSMRASKPSRGSSGVPRPAFTPELGAGGQIRRWCGKRQQRQLQRWRQQLVEGAAALWRRQVIVALFFFVTSDWSGFDGRMLQVILSAAAWPLKR